MKLLKILLVIALIIPASAALEVKYADECGSYEPLISFDSNETYSHPAEPNYYSNNVCVSGIESSSISTSCKSNSGFYLSSREENAHFSIFDSYNLHVCTGRMAVTTSTGSCPSNSTVLFSASSKDDAHVSKPSVFDTKVCGTYQSPENVTVEMEFNLSSSDKIYFDGQRVQTERDFSPPAEFPYLVSDSDDYVSGLVTSSFLKAERNLEDKNLLSITKESNRANFILPLTQGNKGAIEGRKQTITGRSFLDKLKPSFGFIIHQEPLVRVSYEPEISLNSELDLSSGGYSISVRKTGSNEVDIS